MEPKDFARIVLRRKRTVAIAVLIVMASAFVASSRQEPVYVAQCRFLFQAAEYDLTNPNARPVENVGSLETNQGVITSPEIALPTAASLGLSLGEVLNTVNVTIEPATQIFRLRVADSGAPHPDFKNDPTHKWNLDPGQRSADICNRTMSKFIQFRRRDARDVLTAQLKTKEGSLKARLDEMEELDKQLSNAKSRSDALSLEIRRNSVLSGIADLQGAITGLNEQLSDGISGGGKVISAAGPGALVGADHKKNLITGLLVGLIFGIGIAMVREYLDDTVKDKEGTQRDLGIPVLAALPAEDEFSELDENNQRTIEAARTLRGALSAHGFPHEKNMLVITSSMAKSRATTLASLAGAVAESGRSVLVIGSDLRSSRTHEAFGIHNSVGLANVVRGQVPFERGIRPAPGMEGVYVMPAGPIIGNPGELLSSEAMAMTLRRARRWADVVLLDAPPVLSAADSSILGAYADGVVLVVSAGRTNRQQATEAKDQLAAAGANVLGAVLVGVEDPSRHNDDLDSFDSFGGYGGYDASSYGAYDAAALDDPDLDNPWYDDEQVTISAYAEDRPAQRRGSAPSKKVAAAAPGQRPARKTTSVPRGGVRTKKAPARKASATKRSTTKKAASRKPAAKKTTAKKTAAKRAPAKKATAKKAPAKRTTARKAPAKGSTRSGSRSTRSTR